MILASSPGCTNVKMSSELKKIEGNFLSKPKNGYCPLDPNILFFCQIVALAVPISVLYGGLYFSSSSASIIAVVFGSIVLTVLCIIIATKPFSGSQDLEDSDAASGDLNSSAVQSIEVGAISASHKSILGNPLQKLRPQSKAEKLRKTKTRKKSYGRESSKGRTTSSECSFQSDAEEGKCLLGPPRISSESDDDGMDLLNINEKVLRREYFGPPSLRNAESKRRISIDKPNYGYGNMVKDFGRSLGDSGLGQIDEDDNPATLEEPISLEHDRPVDQNLPVPKEMECTEEPEKLEECILLRLFPKSPKMGTFAMERDSEMPTATPPFRDCETCITPRAMLDEGCQTSTVGVDASCDVIFVDERKNRGSQTSWLDSMKTINTAQNVAELYGEQSRIDKVIQTSRTSPKADKQLAGNELDKKQTKLDGFAPSADKMSIVDFVLRGKFSTPCKPSLIHKQDAELSSNAYGSQKNARNATRDQKSHTAMREDKDNLAIIGSGATVSSYHSSNDWWHAANRLEKSFYPISPVVIPDIQGNPRKTCPGSCRYPNTSGNNVRFQPKNCGLLATESSIEDMRRKGQQIDKSKPKLHSSPRKREDANRTSSTKILPLDPCSPPRKVQRKVEWPMSPIRNISKGSSINYSLSAIASKPEILNQTKNLYHQPAKLNFGPGTPQQRYDDSKCSPHCRKNVTAKLPQPPVKSDAIILVDDSSDVASITESAPTDCGSGDGSPQKCKAKTDKLKKGVSRVESTIFKKSSSSYDNVTIERVLKQKKKTLKKFT